MIFFFNNIFSRDKRHPYNFQSVGELLKSLQSKRQKLETILDQPLLGESTLAKNVADSRDTTQSHEVVEEKNAEEARNRGKEKVDSSKTVASGTQNANTNQKTGGKKGKGGNNKSKKKRNNRK